MSNSINKLQEEHLGLTRQEKNLLNKVLDSLKYMLFPLNGSLGMAEPAEEFRKDGMIAYADGTNWNPNSGGAGVYAYYGGSWHKLS